VYYILSQQHNVFRLYDLAGDKAAEIDTGRYGNSLTVSTVPDCLVPAPAHDLIIEYTDHPSCRVINCDPHTGALADVEGYCRRRVERIRMDRLKCRCGWQDILRFPGICQRLDKIAAASCPVVPVERPAER
jgi:hypothetical protein